MATDGVKIIDGDDAHDLYWGIMDLYDSGADIETIRQEFPIGTAYYDFDYEIHITAYALAFWEIGALTEEVLQEVRLTIDKGVGVAEWTEECGEREGKARQRELDRLWKKISQQNLNIRKRKKYKVVSKFHFSEGDVLTFRGSNDLFHSCYLLFISQHRGECVYHFIPIVFKSREQPRLEDIVKSQLVGYIIPSTLNAAGFEYGLASTGVLHQQLSTYKPHLEKIGNFSVLAAYRSLGSQGGSRNWDDFVQWHETIEQNRKAFGMKLIEVKDAIQV